MILPDRSECARCVDRRIAQAVLLLGVVSDVHDQAEERRVLNELLARRMELADRLGSGAAPGTGPGVDGV